MRRHDDGHMQRQPGAPPPFRVLGATESPYLTAPQNVVAPPPPRAPEPYKITPASSAYARAHRRSSFVIIAETRPPTPESRSPSPPSGLATGRVSPFRGRGFKGPPPRSRSRPPSPDADSQRKRNRNEKQGSISQQNSPRRSLIPQPTRRRSTSLPKAEASPKFGRRADSRNRLNGSDSRSRLSVADLRSRTNLTDSRNRLNASDSRNRSISNVNGVGNGVSYGRRQLSKPPTRLSPIQGTPTKPEKSNLRSTANNRFRDASKTSTKPSRYGISPSKNTNTRRTINDKSSNKDRLDSPSKIPLKTSKFGSNASLNSNRFIKPLQPDKISGKKNEKDNRQSNNDSYDSNTEGGSNHKNETDRRSNGTHSGERSEDMALLELLKQTSGATGTSSVVNTTTTTAAQPLHIDANTVLVEKDEKRSYYDKSKYQDSGKSSNSATSKDDSPVVVSGSQNHSNGTQKSRSNEPGRFTAQLSSSKLNRTANDYYRTKNIDDKVNSPAGTDSIGGQSKSSVQPVRNIGRSNGISGSTEAVDRRQGNKSQGPSSIERNSEVGSAKTDRTTNSKIVTGANGRKNGEDTSSSSSVCTVGPGKPNDSKNPEKDDASSSKNASNKTVTNGNDVTSVLPGKVEGSAVKNVARTVEDTRVSNTTTSTSALVTNTTTTTTSSKTNGVPANSVAGAVNVRASANNSGVRARNENNRGSNVSLKSSGGASIGSIESIRSTDTGVSVDTVKGVSSPRETTGVHVVKRPQEIETLSGNIVRSEQNGEPAVPAGSGEAERVPEKILTRWRRSLGRYCERCPSMRCLACRRDPKDLLWARSQAKKQAKETMRSQAETAAAPAPTSEAAANNAAPAGCWTRFKERCRCTRLQNIKMCTRSARVAPAETTPCCPPERGIGAICRRAFSCCKCKRNDVQRTKNIRAKHSLTSVAPPPLSEEPKVKIPDVLVEHNSLMRGAIPCLPVPLAWFCLVWNILLPGSGTVWSGLFNLCVGQPRFSPVAGLKSRLGAFIVNLVVGVGQLFTVLFCLVGWGWSIWWGITMVRLAGKYKRFKASEAASGDPEARGGEPAALPPGVPSQALRGMERAR